MAESSQALLEATHNKRKEAIWLAIRLGVTAVPMLQASVLVVGLQQSGGGCSGVTLRWRLCALKQLLYQVNSAV